MAGRKQTKNAHNVVIIDDVIDWLLYGQRFYDDDIEYKGDYVYICIYLPCMTFE